MTNQAMFETPAWHLKRLAFTRARPGTLSLQNGRIAFVTGPAGCAESLWYENDDLPDHTLFDLPLATVDVTCNLLLQNLTIRDGSERHIIVFAMSKTGSHFEQATNLAKSIAFLNGWRKTLSEEGVLT